MIGIDWDDVLLKELIIKWEVWVFELLDLFYIVIFCCLRLVNLERVDLYFFFDVLKDVFV